MLVIDRSAVPVEFEIVTTCAALVVPTCWLPNASGAGLSTMTGAMPVPVKAIVTNGFVGSVVLNMRLPARTPAAVGVNVKLMLHVAPLFTVLHALVCVKSAGLDPVNAMPLMISVPGPLFVIETL